MAKRRGAARSAHGVPSVEGVQFSIGTATACAVRTESRDIAVRVSQRGQLAARAFGWIPVVRGALRLCGALYGQLSALSEAGDLEPQKSYRGHGSERGFARLFRTTPQRLAAMRTAILLPMILLLLLVLLPMGLGEALARAGQPRALCNGVACAVRVLCVFPASFLVCRLKLIDRMCMYRGAAAKVKNAAIQYGMELTHEQAVLSSRITLESDGAFLLLTVAVAFILFSCVSPGSALYGPHGRLLLTLLAAGIVNELVRPLERAKSGSMLYEAGRPYRALQRLFTIEPHNQMIEVAVCAWQAAAQNDLSEEEP